MMQPQSQTQSLSCLCEQFLAEGTRDKIERPYLPSTLRTWGPNLRAFLRWLEARSQAAPTLAHWTSAHLTAYRDYLNTKPTLPGRGKPGGGVRPRTLHSHFAALRALERYLYDAKLLSEQPAAALRLPELDNTQQAILLETEVEALLAACDRLYPPRRRLLATAVLSVFFCTALRYEDVRGLRLRDVHIGSLPDDCYLVAEHSKGDKTHIAYMPPETVAALTAWLDERNRLHCAPENDWLWPITKTRRIGDVWWRELRRELEAIAGLNLGERFQAHAARRAAATHMEDADMPLSLIQEALGHENIETTILYLNKSRRRRAENAHRQGWKRPASPDREPPTPEDRVQRPEAGGQRETSTPASPDPRPPIQPLEERVRHINPYQRRRFLDRR